MFQPENPSITASARLRLASRLLGGASLLILAFALLIGGLSPTWLPCAVAAILIAVAHQLSLEADAQSQDDGSSFPWGSQP